MALVVGINSYLDLSAARDFWADRAPEEWSRIAVAAANPLLVRATDYVDREFDFLGERTDATQRLKWPRTGITLDGEPLDETVTPWQILEATALVAELYRQGTYDLDTVLTDDKAAVQVQKVDVITIAYDTSRRLQGGDIPTHVFSLLRPLLQGDALART